MTRKLLPDELLTPPAAYPVTLAEVKARLRIETADYDADLAAMIAAATTDVETYLGRALITRSYRGFLDGWPDDRDGGGRAVRHVEIPMPPLVSIDYVKTWDDSDAATVWDPADYYADTHSTFGRLVRRRGQPWPRSEPMRAANAVEIGWTCGVGAALRPFLDDYASLGLMLTVAAYNENRGDASAPDALPDNAMRALGSRRLTWL
ncbi:MAG TPA: phage head-tail connector protein [Caulobacteraceae bacterium]|jgi:uncharacterized phiE125 gp8 family phage protein